MKCYYSESYLLKLLDKQLSFFLITHEEMKLISKVLRETMLRVEINFSANSNKYYKKDGETFFNPFHSGQWCVFLYYLSNTLYNKNIDTKICDKVYYLNRMLNGVDLFYEVVLPEIFMMDHPLGSVIGRGIIRNYFSFSQGCTIGNNKGVYPNLGENVKMLSNSKIIGKSNIGNNVIIAANTYVKDQDVDSNTLVFGMSPHLIFKSIKNA